MIAVTLFSALPASWLAIVAQPAKKVKLKSKIQRDRDLIRWGQRPVFVPQVPSGSPKQLEKKVGAFRDSALLWPNCVQLQFGNNPIPIEVNNFSFTLYVKELSRLVVQPIDSDLIFPSQR